MMLALIVGFTLTATTAFAKEVTVKKEVLKAFQTEFTNASEVKWTIGETFYKAAFTMGSQHLFAFYSLDGELMGVTRNISTVQLPVYLQTSLKKNYSDKWVTELFEVSNADGTTYYLTLENADSKLILKSSDGGDWKVYKKNQKA